MASEAAAGTEQAPETVADNGGGVATPALVGE